MLCILHRSKHHINAGPLDAEKSPSNGEGVHKHEADGDNYYGHEVGADDIKMNEMKMHQKKSTNKEREQVLHPKLNDGVCKSAKLNFNDDIFGPHISGEERPQVA
ncbi:hypothetical protein niasHT_027055 [Heterodera trifolii]|uniref:Uncharacterized protein n=1 Tax=Heterodera trifolii TaxID=157864 RepID=A0ABD2JGB0_9BILA